MHQSCGVWLDVVQIIKSSESGHIDYCNTVQVFVQLVATLEYVNIVNTVSMLYFQKEPLHWQSSSYAMYCPV